jgi:general secretion pathway protein M
MNRISSIKTTAAGSGLRSFWQQRTARERHVLELGGGLLALALLWLAGVEPALDGRERWRRDLPQLRADAARAQALSQQLAATPPRAANAAAAVDKAALEASLAANGLRAQSLNVQDAGGVLLVRATFADVSFAALSAWLQQQQQASKLSVSEASVTARERLDCVDAQFTLRRLP